MPWEMAPPVTFANGLGEALAPFLLWLRSLGFFEWYVYMPVMTGLAIWLFRGLARALDGNGTFAGRRGRAAWLASYFGLCFLVTNGLAVGLKTLIVEELDYPARVWFEAYVGPLHFYIVAVALAYLVVVARNRAAGLDRGLALFVQVGLLAGYAVGVFRVLNEPISAANPTAGLSGFINVRVVRLLQLRPLPAVHRPRAAARAARLTSPADRVYTGAGRELRSQESSQEAVR